MKNGFLSTDQMVGVDPGDKPLTEEDVRHAVGYFYEPWAARIVLVESPDVVRDRTHASGSGNVWRDDRGQWHCQTDTRGLWVRLEGEGWARSGHLAWGLMEKTIRDMASRQQIAALDLAVTAEEKVRGAYWRASAEASRTGAASPEHPVEELVRLANASRDAWQAIITQRQLDLFELAAPGASGRDMR